MAHRVISEISGTLLTLSGESSGNLISAVSYKPNPDGPTTDAGGGEISPPPRLADGSNPGSELLPVPLPKDDRDGHFARKPIGRTNEGSSLGKQSGSGTVLSLHFSPPSISKSAFWQLAMGLRKVLGEGRTGIPGNRILMELSWLICFPRLVRLKGTGCGARLRVSFSSPEVPLTTYEFWFVCMPTRNCILRMLIVCSRRSSGVRVDLEKPRYRICVFEDDSDSGTSVAARIIEEAFAAN